jgi:hypothetical protein
MGDFFEMVAAVCLANYILAFVAVASRNAADKRRMKKMVRNALENYKNNA